MNINRFIQKYYVDIFFLIILLVIILGGMISTVNVAADDSISTVSHTDISSLMQSAQITETFYPQQSPDFTLPSLNGENIQLGQKSGKVVLLSFWATW